MTRSPGGGGVVVDDLVLERFGPVRALVTERFGPVPRREGTDTPAAALRVRRALEKDQGVARAIRAWNDGRGR
jgi:hypothetical protein